MSQTRVPDNALWGARSEVYSTYRYDLERANNGDQPYWYDVVAPEDVVLEPPRPGATEITLARGTPLDVKSCRYRITDGQSRRRGRFWIKKRSHEKLAGSGGEYFLVVYDEDEGILASGTIPARRIDMIVSWSPTGSRQGEQAAKVPWSQFFETDAVDPDDPEIAVDELDELLQDSEVEP